MTFTYHKKNNSTEEIIASTNFLIDRYNFATMKDTDEIYYYDSNRGIYLQGGEILIKSELASMHAYIPTHQVTEIINTIKSKHIQIEKNLIQTLNGLHVKTV